jgi:hypothetical protein
MAGKSKAAIKKAKEAEELLKVAQEELEAAKKADQDLLEKVKTDIEKVCKDNSVFCGVVLDLEGIMNIIKLAIEKGSLIKIPYSIFIDDTISEETIDDNESPPTKKLNPYQEKIKDSKKKT